MIPDKPRAQERRIPVVGGVDFEADGRDSGEM
jgi:hypothetical protein